MDLLNAMRQFQEQQTIVNPIKPFKKLVVGQRTYDALLELCDNANEINNFEGMEVILNTTVHPNFMRAYTEDELPNIFKLPPIPKLDIKFFTSRPKHFNFRK